MLCTLLTLIAMVALLYLVQYGWCRPIFDGARREGSHGEATGAPRRVRGVKVLHGMDDMGSPS